jgi:hypothetical protein
MTELILIYESLTSGLRMMNEVRMNHVLPEWSRILREVCWFVLSVDTPVGSATMIWFSRANTFHSRVLGNVF